MGILFSGRYVLVAKDLRNKQSQRRILRHVCCGISLELRAVSGLGVSATSDFSLGLLATMGPTNNPIAIFQKHNPGPLPQIFLACSGPWKLCRLVEAVEVQRPGKQILGYLRGLRNRTPTPYIGGSGDSVSRH